MNGTLSADILSFCGQHGINVTEFGRLVGLPKQDIWNIKEGRLPDPQTLGEIRKLLDRQVATKTVREEVRMSRQRRQPRLSQTVAQDNEARIIAQFKAGVSSNKIAAELGVGGRDVRRVLEREELIRQIRPTINASDLSLTDREKLEAGDQPAQTSVGYGVRTASRGTHQRRRAPNHHRRAPNQDWNAGRGHRGQKHHRGHPQVA